MAHRYLELAIFGAVPYGACPHVHEMPRAPPRAPSRAPSRALSRAHGDAAHDGATRGCSPHCPANSGSRRSVGRSLTSTRGLEASLPGSSIPGSSRLPYPGFVTPPHGFVTSRIRAARGSGRLRHAGTWRSVRCRSSRLLCPHSDELVACDCVLLLCWSA